MTKTSDKMERERALAEALTGVASDMRLVDAADFVAFVRTAQFANIANIVASSAELYFKPGTLRFGRSCEADVGWDGQPLVTVSLEFQHKGVLAFCRLMLAADHPSVEIDGLCVTPPCDSTDAETARFIEALNSARISPVRGADTA